LVMDESPTGDKQSSPQVNKKYVTTNHPALACAAPELTAAPHEMTKKPAARPNKPSANFTGIDGLELRFANHTHKLPNTGAKITIHNGLIFCNILAGIVHPAAKLVKR